LKNVILLPNEYCLLFYNTIKINVLL